MQNTILRLLICIFGKINNDKYLFEWVEAFDVVVLVEAVAMLDLTAWEVPSTVVAPLALVVVVVVAVVVVAAVVVVVAVGDVAVDVADNVDHYVD